MRYICRTCSRMADPATAKNLFEPSSDSVLRQIEILTNLQLKENDKLPRFICKECQHDLQIAIDFRRVCIEAQELLELQLNQVEKGEESLQSLVEEYLDDCSEEISNSSLVQQDNDEPVLKPEAIDDLVAIKPPQVLQEFPSEDELSDENFDLSPSSKLAQQSYQNTEDIDNPDSSSHTCSKCGLDFDNVDELKLHKYHLHDVPPNTKFICDHCGEGFRSAAALTRHCNMIDLPLLVSCSKCSNKFHNQILLEVHMERCQKPADTQHVCHICGKRLTTSYNLKSHLVRHSGTKPHKCDQCDSSFAAAAELSSHRKTHTSERPYTCRYNCGKTFRFCSARSMHERVHMDASKRIYQCEYCPKSYITPSDCRAHQKYHNLTRDFSCDICRISFKTLKHYTSHTKSNAHKTLVARDKATQK